MHRITPCKFQRKQKKHFRPRQDTNKQYSHENNHKQYYKEDIIVIKHMLARKDVRSVVTQSKYQCKNCHKCGHFSSLCYKKIGYENKRSLESGSPKAHQLKVGSVCAQDSICSQSEDFSSSDESFCL